ncbi:MAG: M15 family metallopeptidase [Clostridia bacterium]|nr:M15 family metallopeptidase [Deltaproteobacteria bacterium]
MTLVALTTTQADTALVDVAKLDLRWKLDVKYATTDNFTRKALYASARCFLRPNVAQMLVTAQKWLDANHKGYTFILKDCYRPVSVQRAMWEVVKDTSMRGYVADPNSKYGSVHNYGCAVDLTIADQNGVEVDMGTAYDHLGKLAEPRHENEYLAEGKLTAKQIAMRQVLRDAMLAGSFKAIPNEWWHFNALVGESLRAAYEPLDIPFEALGGS